MSTTYTATGFRLTYDYSDPTGNPNGYARTTFEVTFSDTTTSISYGYDQNGLVVSPSGTDLRLDGVLVDDLAVNANLYSDLIQLNWSGGSTVFLYFEFEDPSFTGSVDYLIEMGGADFPNYTSLAAFLAAEATETNATVSLPDAPFAQGTDIPLSLFNWTSIVDNATALVIDGTTADDFLVGSADGEEINGFAGNDVIEGGGGNDTLNAGAGFDAVSFTDQALGVVVSLLGGTASTGDGATSVLSGFEDIFGGDGADTLTGNAVQNYIFGGTGDDSIDALGGDDSVNGEEGNDFILGGFGFDTLTGGLDDDTLNGQGNADEIYGGFGDDSLIGEGGTDRLEGEEGNDRIFAGDGADRAFGGDGDDLIRAGSNFGTSVDGVEGGAGNDTIYGEGGYDLLLGGSGDDVIDGGNQADDLRGEAGNDTLIGGNGFDRLFGGDGDDLLQDFDGQGGLFGQNGNDTIQNGDAAVNIFAGAGNDLIEAGGGNDNITANAGFDTLNGGAGDDTLRGSFNADTFVFADGDGNDVVLDFDAFNALEKIDLSAVTAITSLADLDLASTTSGAATQVVSDVLIDTGGGNSILLLGVNIADLDAGDFLF